MPQAHKHLLISFKSGAPDWTLLGIANVENLPAVRWRLANLSQLSAERRAELLDSLKRALGL